MKTQNDILREEFKEVLKREIFLEEIKVKKLNESNILRFFEILLEKNNGSDDSSFVDSGRARFETFVINTLKEQKK